MHYKQNKQFQDTANRRIEIEEDVETIKKMFRNVPRDTLAYAQAQRLVSKLLYERNKMMN